MNGDWVRRPTHGTTVVFVHGVLSSGETCWRHSGGGYWPNLLAEEISLSSVGVYVFTYQTNLFSGTYRLGDVVDALKEHARLDGVLASDQIIFVCHSMGGIVVRKFLVERQSDLISSNKVLGLFLVASPSLGSSYADWLSPMAAVLGHSQASVLRFVRGNEWLMDLDKEFTNLKEARTLDLRGKELVEDKFVVLSKLWRRQVVEPFSGARYFGDPYKVPGSDHFSIAKPSDPRAIQHRLLVQFVESFRSDNRDSRNREYLGSSGNPVDGSQVERQNARGHPGLERDQIAVVFPRKLEFPAVRFSIVNQGHLPMQVTDIRVAVAAKVKDEHGDDRFLTGPRMRLKLDLHAAEGGDVPNLLEDRTATLAPKDIEAFLVDLTLEDSIAVLDIELEYVGAGLTSASIYNPHEILLVHAPTKTAPGAVALVTRSRAFELLFDPEGFMPWNVSDYRSCPLWHAALLRAAGRLLIGDVENRWQRLQKLLDRDDFAGPVLASIAETATRIRMPDLVMTALDEWTSQPQLIKRLGISDSESYAVVIERSLERAAYWNPNV